METWMPDEAIEECGLNKLPDYVTCDLFLFCDCCNFSRAKAYKMKRVNVGMP